MGEFFKIYFSDLTEEAKAELLDALGISDPAEMNWDIDMCPIAMYPIPHEEREGEEERQYVVTMVDSCEMDPVMYPPTTYMDACDYVNMLWEDCYNTEIANGGEKDIIECFHEDEYAIVRWKSGRIKEFFIMKL